MIFRIAQEWFALPTVVVAEVGERRAIHSIPHRRSGIVSGVTNVTLFVRADADGVNPIADNANELYSGGAGVGADHRR